jgi:hypothetical protein
MAMERERPFDPDYVREVSLTVYRMRLDQACPGGADRQVNEDEDSGKKQRGRAGAYDALTRAYLTALGVNAPRVPKG